LLSDRERAFLQCLSVFSGGWSLDATVVICAVEGFDEYEVFDLLTQLVNESMVGLERRQGEEARYTLLETICQYAAEKLKESGRVELARSACPMVPQSCRAC
jgi:predicted ATPase